MPQYDVVTLGETMLRLTPPGFQRIEQATSFQIHIGGSESNTAVGLARLGFKVAWFSRLTDNPMGRLIAGTIAHYGVDTAHIVWTEADRVGVYFVEEGKPPRSTQVFYDRANSAAARMTPEDIPAHLFTPDGARLLHLTGIPVATGTGAALLHAAQLAKAAGWKVSFDFNYRSKLWSAAAAQEKCHLIMQYADIIFISQDDARMYYTGQGEALVQAIAPVYPAATIVMTAGSEGSFACEPGGKVLHQPVFPAEEVDRIGGGDAFSAGFLYGYLAGDSSERLATALKWAAAVAALKYTISGDFPLIERAEAERLVTGGSVRKITR